MKPNKPTSKPYTRRSASYKEEALKLADRIGYAIVYFFKFEL